MSDQLPRGWTVESSGKLFEFVTSGSRGWAQYYAEEGALFVRIGNLDHDTISLDLRDRQHVTPPPNAEGDRTRLRAGDVLVSITAELGMVGLVPDEFGEAYINQHIALARPRPGADPRFLAWFFASPGKTQLLEMRRGVTKAGLGLDDIRNVPVLLPPLNEQRRIVAKLEALQARSRRARAALDAVPPLLEKLRQSILAAAFRGDLTKDWRAKNKNVEPAEKLLARTPEPGGKSSGRAASTSVRPGRAAIAVGDPGGRPPSGWKWVPLSRIARMESGHTPSREHAEYWDGGIPWIGIKDARTFHGREIPATFQTVTELGLANSAARLLPARTVCLSRTASVGYVTIMGTAMATSQDFANWICSNALLPEYLMLALLAEGEHIRTFGEGSTHTTIYFPELKALHICLAPLEEQREVVRRVTGLLEGVARIRENASAQLARQNSLDRSLLAKAFRGELVPQDPTDEPAEVMLARVRDAGPAAGAHSSRGERGARPSPRVAPKGRGAAKSR